METIIIHSPQRFMIQGISTGDDYKRKINIENYTKTTNAIVLSFASKGEADRLVEFINYVRQVNKVDGAYFIQFCNDKFWIQVRIIEQTDATTIILKYFEVTGGLIGGNVKEI